MTRFFRHPWGWTSLAPLLCTAHCIATPIALVVAPQLVPGAGAEWALLGVTVVIGGVTFAAAARGHGTLLPFLIAGVGLAAWAGSLLHLYGSVPETLSKGIASAAVAVGFIWNSRLHCATESVQCAACEHEVDEAGADAGKEAVARAAPLTSSNRAVPLPPSRADAPDPLTAPKGAEVLEAR